ncbi:MAG: hypothetical protein LBR78_02855 [Holosporales bacterium]|jgi:hypothetical protein|nr:hypothetical protein [Holosporales bacterium]
MQRVVARQAHQLRCYQELIESYERLSRKLGKKVDEIERRREGILQALMVTDRQREAALKAYQMLEWCGGIYDGRDELVEFISRTAATIDGETISGRTVGWTWAKYGTGSILTESLAYSISVSYTPPGSEQTIWLSYRIRNRNNGGVIRFLNTGEETTGDYEPLPIRLEALPPHARAEVAVITLRSRGEQGFSQVRLHTTASRIGALHNLNDGYSTWIAPPIEEWVSTAVPDPGSSLESAPNGPPVSLQWRAIIGTYTAPEPVEEPHYRPT